MSETDEMPEFVRGHASTSGDLNVYGDEFGEFLADYPHAANLPYLADVARLEWAIDEAQRAIDRPREPEAVLAALSALPPDHLTAARLTLETFRHYVGRLAPRAASDAPQRPV